MINTGEVMKMLDEAYDVCERLNGLDETNIESNNKNLTAAKAKINGDLLYLAHLLDVAKVEAMNQYHRFRGKDTPSVTASQQFSDC